MTIRRSRCIGDKFHTHPVYLWSLHPENREECNFDRRGKSQLDVTSAAHLPIFPIQHFLIQHFPIQMQRMHTLVLLVLVEVVLTNALG